MPDPIVCIKNIFLTFLIGEFNHNLAIMTICSFSIGLDLEKASSLTLMPREKQCFKSLLFLLCRFPKEKKLFEIIGKSAE